MSALVPALVCAFTSGMFASSAMLRGGDRGRCVFCAVCFAIAAIAWAVSS